MPYRIDWEPHGAVRTHWGFVTGIEAVFAANEITANLAFDDLHYVIVDMLQITGMSISREQSDDVAAIRIGARFTNPNIRIALLSANQSVIEMMWDPDRRAAMNTYEARVFGSMGEARAWLNGSDPQSASRQLG